MRPIRLLLALALLRVAQPTTDPTFLLRAGGAGPVEIGMPVDRLYAAVTREKTQLVDEFAEGMFTPALVIKVDGSRVPRPLVARVREAPCNDFRVDAITVYDPRFRTPEGIGVGSSLADLKRAYQIEPAHGESGPMAIVRPLAMTFGLSGDRDGAVVRSVWLYLPPERVKRRCGPPSREAPREYKVRLDTSKGPMTVAVHRAWAPHGADRFFELVSSEYYDDARFFRIRKGTWAQFGIAADPTLSEAWRAKTIPDDPFVGVSNTRGTVAFAFKDPDARTTQVFINLQDNSETHDKEPFVVFGEVESGMEVADALYSEYGEAAGGGIRAGRQDPVFEGGNTYLKANFPRLDYITTARIVSF